MVQALDVRVVWSSPRFEVVTSTWDSDRHVAEDERQTGWAAVEWMRRGTFRKAVRGRTVVADTNHAVFFNPREVFRVSHPVGRSNAATSIRLSPGLLAGILRDVDPAGADDAVRPFRVTHALTPTRCHLVQQALVTCLGRGEAVDPMMIEETVLFLVQCVLQSGYRGAPAANEQANTAGSHRRVAGMQEFLNASFAHPVRLDDVATAAGCSVWHAAHLFSSCTGIPIHRYLRRVRLRETLARVCDGVTDFTRAALEGGFASHSHFTSAFRREFGVTPSAMRAARARNTLSRLLDTIRFGRGD